MAGGPALAELNCTSNTHPRVKVTVCGGTLTFLGHSFTDGESVIVCPDGYATSGVGPGFTIVERWLFNNTNIFNQSSPGLALLNDLSYTITTPAPPIGRIKVSETGSFFASVFDDPGGMTTTGTSLTGNATGIVPLAANLNPGAGGIPANWFGSVTLTGGITIKWEPISGSGQPWASWKNEASFPTTVLATTSTDSPCP